MELHKDNLSVLLLHRSVHFSDIGVRPSSLDIGVRLDLAITRNK